MWAKTGSRPLAFKQTEYEWVYVYGAVCPATGESVGMIGASIGIEWMNQHLRWISEHVRASPGAGGEAVHVILILDRAGWHVSAKLQVPANITLLHLPPYSPELNPVERLWHWLQSHCLSNRLYRNVEHLYAAATQAWNTVTPERLKTVCRTPYMERGD